MYRKLFVGISLLAISCAANADSIQIKGSIKASAEVTTSSVTTGAMLSSERPNKDVYLMNVQLTPEQQNNFFQRHQNQSVSISAKSQDLPSQADVGMNGVPVLDQGAHGTCATFANTAAIDALLGKGDYVSQLCNLTLGNYLEKRGYAPSGWDGSNGQYVLNQMLAFGFVSKDNQQSKSCGALKEYPIYDENQIGKPMSLDDFRGVSEQLDSERNGSMFYWKPLLDFTSSFGLDATDTYDGEKVLTRVKETLAKKVQDTETRLTFGVLLPYRHCNVGACARFHKRNDTWAMVKEIKDDPHPRIGGHEMIITGYDDEAVATDQDNVKHKGILKLRNSWGSDVGDKGEFYMTYDFFKEFAMEVQKVSLAKNIR